MKLKRGIGLLEILLVLSIVSVLLTLTFRYYVTTQRSQQIYQSSKQMTSLVTGIERWRGRAKTYTGLTAEGLYNIGAVSNNEYNPTNKSVISVWNTAVELGPHGTGDKQFSITYTALPEWACNNLARQYEGNQQNPTKASCENNTNFVYIGGP